MPYILDDSKKFTIALSPHKLGASKITILSVESPPCIETGKTFEIRIRWRNDGGAGKMWYRILDDITEDKLVTQEPEDVPSNDQIGLRPDAETGIITIGWPPMPSKTLRLRLEVGHIE